MDGRGRGRDSDFGGHEYGLYTCANPAWLVSRSWGDIMTLAVLADARDVGREVPLFGYLKEEMPRSED
jgi:hypothetical protein